MMNKKEETYQTTTTGTQHGKGKTWTHHCLLEINPDTNPHIIKTKAHATPTNKTRRNIYIVVRIYRKDGNVVIAHIYI